MNPKTLGIIAVVALIAVVLGVAAASQKGTIEMQDFKVDRNEAKIGEPITVTFNVKNNAAEIVSGIEIVANFTGNQNYFKIDRSGVQNVNQLGAGGTTGTQTIVITGLSTGTQTLTGAEFFVGVKAGGKITDFERVTITLTSK